jgi:tRNA dimethylallyltransferase
VRAVDLFMNKLLVICGPTATGKTKLAVYLAKKLNGEIVSADSRQVYRGINIGTGKDLPKDSQFSILNSQLGGYYEIEGVKIWGYDLVGPEKKFSVAQYENFANKIITRIQKIGKLPILVGGTGLYIKAITEGIPTANIPRNEGLRKNLENKSADELFECLAQIDPVKAALLNLSDKKNPRRLVRAIEIALYKLERKTSEVSGDKGIDQNTLCVGLTTNKEDLARRIEMRFGVRDRNEVVREIKKLLENGISWSDQSISSIGYRQWREYFETKRLSTSLRRRLKSETVEKWKSEEKKYAKRQLTWFKKDRRINWFDISDPNWQESVEKLVRKWDNNEIDLDGSKK